MTDGEILARIRVLADGLSGDCKIVLVGGESSLMLWRNGLSKKLADKAIKLIRDDLKEELS